MRLVVHIGAPRAATGFLQRCLGLNAEALRRRGVYLPSTGRLNAPDDRIAHHNLGWELLKHPAYDEANGTWSELATELQTVEAETVVLASETFGQLAVEPALRKDLRARLTALSDDVTLVYTARDPLERINAMFLQTVRALGEPFSFDDYVDTAIRAGLCDLYATTKYWLDDDAVRFVALRFDEMQQRGPLETFLEAFDATLPPRAIVVPDDDDRGTPGSVAVEVLRALNLNLRVIHERFSRRSAAANRIANAAERRAVTVGWYDEPFWGWEQRQAEWALGRLTPGNDAFAQAVWGTDWPIAPAMDRVQNAVNLIEVDRKTHNDALTFVANFTQRYLKLVNDPGNSELGEVFDAAMVVTDEAERLVPASARRPASSRAS